ncbi:stage II sporulation protein M [Aneurinibacillus soli]|uniref:Uncharacterized protein n=1 Tax=Aneurinibacillus soli TaxID=1500254 RepID=A0A0U5BD31_9BACL|nr:stage II sporulation protein M [Aneurinibacillus soli]PYE57549.1 stage II sporulation protein M [Aneurinibacillus soli]BAU26062.1 hypothetical protein CB4_00151 [Aneurinibacillus soli]
MVKRLSYILQENRRYIGIAALLMVMGGAIGYISADQFAETLKRMIDGILKSAKQEQTGADIFWLIFRNNVMVAMMMIGLGIFFFGIYPAFTLLMNGAILGFLLKTISSKGISASKVLIGGILPHGILELSMIILSGAIGMKLGIRLYEWVLAMLVPERRRMANDRLYKLLEQLPLLFGTVVLGLFVAAIIETMITPYILQALLTVQEASVMKQIFK